MLNPIKTSELYSSKTSAASYIHKKYNIQLDLNAPTIKVVSKLRDLGEIDYAIKLLLEVQNKDHSSQSFIELAVNYQLKDDFSNAIKYLKLSIKKNPKEIDAYAALYNEYIRQGLVGEAKRIIDKALIVSNDIKFKLLNIHLLQRQGLIEEAILYCEKIFDENIDNISAWIYYIKLNIYIGEFNKVNDCIAKLKIKNSSQEQQILFLKAIAAKENFDLESSLDLITDALSINPKNAAFIKHKIELSLMRFDTKSAHDNLEELKKILENNSSSRIRRSSNGGFQRVLYNEMRNNPFQQKLIAETYLLPLKEKFLALKNIFKEDPSSFFSALHLLITAMRLGVFTKKSEEVNIQPQEIPKRIVQYWHEKKLPYDINKFTNSWKKLHSDYKYEIFNDESANLFINKNFDTKTFKAFITCKTPAMKADLFRLLYLSIHGGIYADADDLCRHNIQPLIKAGSNLILVQGEMGQICNHFIAVTPKNKFILYLIEKAKEHILTKQGSSWFATGPALFTISFCKLFHVNSNLSAPPLSINLISSYEFKRYVSPHIARQKK